LHDTFQLLHQQITRRAVVRWGPSPLVVSLVVWSVVTSLPLL